jgi:lipoprotein-anchoring transpeptidase ErfK/SrfK
MIGTTARRTTSVLATAVALAALLSGTTATASAPRAPLAGSSSHTATPRPAPPKPPVVVVPKNAGHRPLPAHSGSGRRIVYSEKTPQRVWLVEADGTIVADYAGSGRADWPMPGTYHVFSQSRYSSATGLTFAYMTRFAHGRHANIGFHTIPRYNGSRRLTHPISALGLPVGHGGCVHLTDAGAAFLFRWARIGTTVVVLR